MSVSEISGKLFAEHPSRFTKKEKTAFLNTVAAHFTSLGYSEGEISIQKGIGRNFVVGEVSSAKYIFTAHYDTPGCNGFLLAGARVFGQTGANILMLLAIIPLLALEGLMGYIAASVELSLELTVLCTFAPLIVYMLLMILPMVIKNRSNRNDNTSGVLGVIAAAELAANDPELRKQCCFVLFDNEEWGLLGSSDFASKNVFRADRALINLDCVGVGDVFTAVTTGKPSQNIARLLDTLEKNGLRCTRKRSRMVFLSDHANFQSSVMLSYTQQSSIGPLYIPNIHSGRDTQCDINMVEDLGKRLIEAISAK